MYERFTDRARKVLQLANQEACRLRHEYVGPEHLLLGLAKEKSGVAAHVLRDAGGSYELLKDEVDKRVTPTVGIEAVLGLQPHTPSTKRAVENAVEEARGLRHTWVGTEHLLLGLLKVESPVVDGVLAALGAAKGALRVDVLKLILPVPGQDQKPPPSPETFTRTVNPGVLRFPRPDDLRDWFAGLAMQAVVSLGDVNPVRDAELAYRVADAMLAARTKPKGE